MRIVVAHVIHRQAAETLPGVSEAHVRTACGLGVDHSSPVELVEDGAASTDATARECRRCYPKEGIVDTAMQTALPLFRKRTDAMTAARTFLEANPHAKALIVKWAHEDIEAGRRPSIGFYAELLRRPKFHVAGVGPYKIDNRIRSCVVRLLIEEFPELGGVHGFELRDSAWDPPAAPQARPNPGGAL